MDAPTQVYVARCQECNGYFAFAVDRGPESFEAVEKMLQQGGSVSRMPLEVARNTPLDCRCSPPEVGS